MKYFLDTYALVEIANGNTDFAKYPSFECHTSVFNLLELAYHALKAGLPLGDVSNFFKYKLEIRDEWVFEAAKFKRQHSKRELSYADSIGYISALKSGLIFVTGDEQFRDMPGVEFIK
ncbi:PIN domain-containing protein [Candidatus Woesearchaeota archaeon]|nr:PIN domain-containing protein [Candidatus Woesearchaeota archaeon]